MRSRIHFFAVEEDWSHVFDYVERKRNLIYTATGYDQLRNPNPPRFLEGRSLPGLGVASAEQCIACYSYAVSQFPEVPIPAQGFTFDGAARYDIYTGDRFGTIRLIHAGRWQDMIIAGLIDTTGTGPRAQSLINAFYAAMKSRLPGSMPTGSVLRLIGNGLREGV